MNFFSVRTNHQITVKAIFDNQKNIKFSQLSWHKDEVNLGDIVYIIVSGDKSKKDFVYTNGLKAIAIVVGLPIQDDRKHFSIDTEIICNLDRIFTKDDFYNFPSLKNAPNIGAETLNPPNQAFRKFGNHNTGMDVIRALLRINPNLSNRKELLTIIDNDLVIDELVMKTSLNVIRDKNDISFDFKKLINDIQLSGLNINLTFVKRFTTCLITKPFVLLTGLSGSGKTKLAQFFATWLTDDFVRNNNNILDLDEVIDSSRVKYKVYKSDQVSVILEQVDTKVKVSLPFELINEWIKVIEANNFTVNTNTREIRNIVGETTKYSTQLNSFESHLKAVAFYVINKFKNNSNFYTKVNQKCIVPVGADWTNREPLLGYPNALNNNEYIKPDNGVIDLLIDAQDYPDIPFFLILDEMNLSHVERYFADFLSAMESEESIKLHSLEEMKSDDGKIIPGEIKLAKNLFIIGTVNVDETTYMFSPKVLDRAGVLEFKVDKSELGAFLDNPSKINISSVSGNGSGMSSDFVSITKEQITNFNEKENIKKELITFFDELKKVGAEFGYRTASEVFQYAGKVKLLESKSENDEWSDKEIIDTAIVQKLLPKLHGSRNKIEVVLKTLGRYCLEDSNNEPFQFEEDGKDKYQIKYPISYEKLSRMHNRVIKDGFTSFAEA